MKIVFSPVISPGAWAIGQSLLPPGFTIEVLEKDPECRVTQLGKADFLMGFLRGLGARDHADAGGLSPSPAAKPRCGSCPNYVD